MRRVALFAGILVMMAGSVVAQNPTGSISGRVTDTGNVALPGVTVTTTSDALQGARTAVTGEGGDYILALLPPGSYAVKFELQGFQTVDTTVKVSAAQSARIDAVMPQATIAEEITVTGAYETISTTTTAASTFEQGVVELLPVPRTLYQAVALAPGVHTTGPSNNITISGAASFENLFMINGVVVNENVRGQAVDVYIEDAIQETTTTTSGISAEYGRFAGGVVNMLTKSGGNEFHASLRSNFDNDKWTAPTEKTISRTDKVNKTFEATLGGRVLRDKLWFFAAGRDRSTTGADQTIGTLVPFDTGTEETRYEGKLTGSPNPSHRGIVSYQERTRDWTNYYFGSRPPVDTVQLYPRSIPEELISLNYTGVLSESFFIEGQYSQRKLTFQASGSRFTDQMQGTPVIDRSTGRTGLSPTFCGVCGDEKRDNTDYILKGSYFLSSSRLGSHDMVAGVDVFSDQVYSNNHQSGSDFEFRVPSFKYDGPNWYPVVPGGPSATGARFYWWPIPELSKGTDFTTQSAFFNDRWRLNKQLSFNLGVRFDKNDGQDAQGKTVSNDKRLSPRLGVSWDPRGDGEWVFSASYGHYVTALAGTGNVANQSPAGNPSSLVWYYRGPAMNTGATGPYMSPTDVLAAAWDWFLHSCDADGNCGPNNASTIVSASFTGFNRVIQGSLKSPYAEELAASAVKRLGSRGMMRLDYVHRDFKDLYETQVDLATGQVDVITMGRNWGKQDLGYVQNSDYLKRTYDGVSLQATFRLDHFDLGGNYTWSHAYGNFNGETSGAGPVTGTANPRYYPEYQDVAWSNPTGDLAIDQRHKARAWVVWNAIDSGHHRLDLSLLQNYYSGAPYGAVGTVQSNRFVTNPGYRTPPTGVNYYYTSRDAFHTDDVSATDIAVNYAFKFRGFGTEFEVFLQPEVQNVFNQQAVVSPNSSVWDLGGGFSQFAAFNPWTATPKECPQGTAAADCTAMGANWQKGTDFGKPTSPGSYQAPRTFRFSIGFRF